MLNILYVGNIKTPTEKGEGPQAIQKGEIQWPVELNAN